MSWVQLAHTHEAKICQVRLAIRITLRQNRKLGKLIVALEGKLDQPGVNQGQRDLHAAEVKGCLGKHGLTGEEWLRHALCYSDGPVVKAIIPIRECDQKSRVCQTLHRRLNPLRCERLRAPRTQPASSMNA